MKKWIVCLTVLLSLMFMTGMVSAAEEKSLMVADFNAGMKPNNIGGDFGAWDKDPTDFSQGCVESFDPTVKHGNTGFSMKIDYDVDSPNPAYNGFWMFLNGLDARPYDTVAFCVKGDKDVGFTTVFKVEIKNSKKEVGKFYATGVTTEWQRIALPIKDFKGIADFSNMTELVIVFEDRIASNKQGVIFIDDVQFTKEQPEAAAKK